MKAWTLIILSVCVLNTSCTRSPQEKGLEFIPEMVHAVPYESFSKAMLEPVEGTISRSAPDPYPYSKSEHGAIAAGKELHNPLTPSEPLLARGKELYGSYCLLCHGATGEGDGPLIPKFPNPPSFKSKSGQQISEGRVFHAITVGYGDMPDHAQQISEQDRWKVALFVKEFQTVKQVSP